MVKKQQTEINVMEHIETLINDELNLRLQKEIERVENDLKKKYSSRVGKDVEITIYCTQCTRGFIVKRKNNKTEETKQQICPHTFVNKFEVKH